MGILSGKPDKPRRSKTGKTIRRTAKAAVAQGPRSDQFRDKNGGTGGVIKPAGKPGSAARNKQNKKTLANAKRMERVRTSGGNTAKKIRKATNIIGRARKQGPAKR